MVTFETPEIYLFLFLFIYFYLFLFLFLFLFIFIYLFLYLFIYNFYCVKMLVHEPVYFPLLTHSCKVSGGL